MIVKLLAEHHLEFLSLKEGCTDSSESTLVKLPHCLKSHVAAHIFSHGRSNHSGSHLETAQILAYTIIQC